MAAAATPAARTMYELDALHVFNVMLGRNKEKLDSKY
jgi:hypothetical protein